MNGSSEEIAAAVLEPHFDAVRDVYCQYGDGELQRLSKVRFVVDKSIHNSPRHFAATRDDGLLMLFAPQFIDLPEETLVAILAHEFGHAADFLFPARFVTTGTKKAIWASDDQLDTKQFRGWQRIWEQRNRDQIEQSADSIAYEVTGRPIKYDFVDSCLLQRFNRGMERPLGLR